MKTMIYLSHLLYWNSGRDYPTFKPRLAGCLLQLGEDHDDHEIAPEATRRKQVPAFLQANWLI